MGDFFDSVVIFLEEYYVYVIGVGLIIILMLIGFLASRHKARKNNDQNGTMVNINEVSTGSINDVANTLKDSNVQPIGVVTSPENSMVAPSQPVTSSDEEVEVLDTVPSTKIEDTFAAPSFTPIAPLTSNIDTVLPAGEEKNSNDGEDFNRAEPIDFSSLNKPEPMTDIKPASPTIDNYFNMTNRDYNEPVTVGPITPVNDTPISVPVTDINLNEPTPIQSVNPMPANEAVTTTEVNPVEVPNEPVTDIKATDYSPFVVDKSQYEDILNGENSSTDESKI